MHGVHSLCIKNMAHKKSGGSTTIHKNREGKRLGVKLFSGQKVEVGGILVRQRGTKILAGENVKVGRDHTLYAIKDGSVDYKNRHDRVVVFVK